MIVYTHKTRAGVKSFKLSISSDGTITATTPRLVPKFLVDQFVQKHLQWIEMQQAKQMQKPQFETANSVTIFGLTYQKKITYDSTQRPGVYILENDLIHNRLQEKKPSDQDEQDGITVFLKHTASQYIVARAHQIAQTMQTQFVGITLKQQKTRWGSCSSKKHLNFNWRLVHFPTPIIDYVIVHELAHLTHMNHSQAFWNLVSQFDPEYKLHKGWLKRNGMTLS